MLNIDLLVTHALLVPMDEAMTVIEDGAIAVHEGKILEAGASADLLSRYHSRRFLDAEGAILMPGLINTHTHVGMAYFKGLADDLLLSDWLNKYIWPAEAKFLGGEFVYHASLHGAAEMARHGITLFNDMYFHERATAQAVLHTGIRAILGEGVLSASMGGHSGAAAMIQYNLDANAEYHDDHVSFSIAPHSIYTCNRDDLLSSIEAAAKAGMRLHLHLSETRDEVENCLRETGMTPAMYLNSLGAFELPVTIAHGTHLTPEECELLAGKGIGVAVCTESNLKLSSGFAPIKAYRESGLRFAMATDGVASNNNLDLLAEAGFTARLHKALNNDPTFLPAPEVLRSVTIDAARVVGMGDKLGSLEAGKLADFILIDVNTLDSKPLYNVYSHLAYVLDSRHITDVFVGGEPVVLDRKLKRLDEAELIERADRYRAEIACGG